MTPEELADIALELYLAEMQQAQRNAPFGGDIELQALSENFGRRIVVYSGVQASTGETADSGQLTEEQLGIMIAAGDVPSLSVNPARPSSHGTGEPPIILYLSNLGTATAHYDLVRFESETLNNPSEQQQNNPVVARATGDGNCLFESVFMAATGEPSLVGKFSPDRELARKKRCLHHLGDLRRVTTAQKSYREAIVTAFLDIFSDPDVRNISTRLDAFLPFGVADKLNDKIQYFYANRERVGEAQFVFADGFIEKFSDEYIKDYGIKPGDKQKVQKLFMAIITNHSLEERHKCLQLFERNGFPASFVPESSVILLAAGFIGEHSIKVPGEKVDKTTKEFKKLLAAKDDKQIEKSLKKLEKHGFQKGFLSVDEVFDLQGSLEVPTPFVYFAQNMNDFLKTNMKEDELGHLESLTDVLESVRLRFQLKAKRRYPGFINANLLPEDAVAKSKRQFKGGEITGKSVLFLNLESDEEMETEAATVSGRPYTKYGQTQGDHTAPWGILKLNLTLELFGSDTGEVSDKLCSVLIDKFGPLIGEDKANKICDDMQKEILEAAKRYQEERSVGSKKSAVKEAAIKKAAVKEHKRVLRAIKKAINRAVTICNKQNEATYIYTQNLKPVKSSVGGEEAESAQVAKVVRYFKGKKETPGKKQVFDEILDNCLKEENGRKSLEKKMQEHLEQLGEHSGNTFFYPYVPKDIEKYPIEKKTKKGKITLNRGGDNEPKNLVEAFARHMHIFLSLHPAMFVSQKIAAKITAQAVGEFVKNNTDWAPIIKREYGDEYSEDLAKSITDTLQTQYPLHRLYHVEPEAAFSKWATSSESNVSSGLDWSEAGSTQSDSSSSKASLSSVHSPPLKTFRKGPGPGSLPSDKSVSSGYDGGYDSDSSMGSGSKQGRKPRKE